VGKDLSTLLEKKGDFLLKNRRLAFIFLKVYSISQRVQKTEE
jgi:hypothetical protein